MPPPRHDLAQDNAPLLKVLLAEDNAVNRKLATTLLEKRGHTVIVTENGREALDSLVRETVDLVLMDVQMPVMDGLEAIRIIREKEQSTGAHLPIIALTAHAMKGDRERCLAAGADDYVTKPIRIAELLAAMSRVTSGTASPGLVAPPSVAMPDSNRLDVAAALGRVEGDRDLLEELVRLFIDECPTNMKDLRRALVAGDASVLLRLAHTIKGAAMNLGAHGVSAAASALEEQTRAGDFRDAAALGENLATEIDLLMPELESLCRKVTR